MTVDEIIEIWNPVLIDGIREHFEVSTTGRVRSVDRMVALKDGRIRDHKGRVLSPVKTTFGYLSVSLGFPVRKFYPIHRLVAISFLSNPENKPEVNHKDGNRTNNHLSNLEWMTRSENMQHCYKILGRKGSLLGVKGKDHHLSFQISATFKDGSVIQYESLQEASSKLGISAAAISYNLAGIFKNRKGIQFTKINHQV